MLDFLDLVKTLSQTSADLAIYFYSFIFVSSLKLREILGKATLCWKVPNFTISFIFLFFLFLVLSLKPRKILGKATLCWKVPNFTTLFIFLFSHFLFCHWSQGKFWAKPLFAEKYLTSRLYLFSHFFISCFVAEAKENSGQSYSLPKST